MWDDVQRFLDFLITQYGVARVIVAPFSLVALLAGVGVIAGGSASFVAVAASLFIAVVIISAISLQLHAKTALLAERARIVNLYTDRFARSIESYAYSIESWDEIVTVKKNGDTALEKWVTIQVGHEDLYSVWSGVHKRGEVSDRQRRRVRVEARGFDENGVLGARYDVTHAWDGNRLQLFIHFEEPASAGEVVRIWLRWEWPRYYKELLDGDIEVVEWSMKRPNKNITTRMIFDRSCGIRNEFHITPYRGCPLPAQSREPDNSLTITVEYIDVPIDVKIGFRLDGREIRR